jgi:hypothetical protein
MIPARKSEDIYGKGILNLEHLIVASDTVLKLNKKYTIFKKAGKLKAKRFIMKKEKMDRIVTF